MTEYEFTPEDVRESLAKHLPGLAAEMDDKGITPEMVSLYLIQRIGKSEHVRLEAMFHDHAVPIKRGGKVKVRETNSFEDWKGETGWEADGEE